MRVPVFDLSDAELVAQAKHGRPEAVGHLFDRHQARIFKYVRARVDADALAQDLTGEVFTRMVASLPGYEPQGVPFTAWLYRIARNLIADHYRKEGGHMSVPIYHAENVRFSDNNPALVIEQQLTLEQVQLALQNIDEAQQEVIRLRFLVGLPLREVAQVLNKSVAAVKSLQYRGLLALRATLVQE